MREYKPMNSEFHAMKTEEAIKALESSLQGLSEEEAKRRLEEFGFNELKERKKAVALRIFLRQFKDLFVIMLLIAISLSVLAGKGMDALTISAIVVLNSVVGFIQEHRSEKAMEAMKKLTAPKARVVRDGRERVIPAREVVPGDIILLESGDRIPADARLVETVNLKTDEAVLTGESVPEEKNTVAINVYTPIADRENMVFMATHVVYGRGKAVVTSTGMNTEFGKIAEMVQAIGEEETPLKLRLRRFAKKLGILVTFACASVFLLEGLRGEPLVGSFFLAVALAVSAVPEGLPAIVTVTLALGARGLAKRNAITRRLSSVETLGSTTVICSDKTGTLTKDEMTVRKIYSNNQMMEVMGAGYDPRGEFYRDGHVVNPEEDPYLMLLLRIGALCSNARLIREDTWRIVGDPTEGALVVVAGKAGIQQDEASSQFPRIGEIPFSSERKRMTTIHSAPNGERFAYVKGAPEIVLGQCTHFLEEGHVKDLTEKEKKKILKINEKMAREALRVLGMAYRKLPDDLKGFTEGSVERGLIFVGLIGMIDPPREEVEKANRLCEQAGIKTVMITGDHKLTAVAIAKELGMLKSGLVLTGAELDKMGDEEFEKIVEDVAVYARVSPQHKLRIVRALKKRGHIVAMTGDGVNDAPALKNADIGIAMGITGTDVTREASDMVLADDNFATIVEAVKEGRNIYDNMRKFIRYLLSSNFDGILVVSTFAMLGLPIPLLPAMILWVNLATDGGPAVALSVDPPTEDTMQRPPRSPKAGILHGMVTFIIAYVILQSGTTIFIFWWKYFWVGSTLEAARTVAFMQVCIFELVVVWNCRSERHNAFKVGFFSNRFLLVAVLASFVLTVSLCYVPVFQLMFGTVPLDLYDWIWILATSGLGFVVLPEVFMRRKP
jgi:Ca2+-transporting ATPase